MTSTFLWRFTLIEVIMNKTKKITQGAMMLAIVGALILLDRMTAFWFTELVVLVVPVVVIMYSAMQSFKDGLLLSVGLIVIAFLLGNFYTTYLIYVPVGIVTGLAYSFGIEKGLDKRMLLIIAIFVYTVGELLVSFVVYPMMGFPVASFIEEFKITMNEMGGISGMNYGEAFDLMGLDFTKMVAIIYIVTTIIMGAMEGVLIHLLSVFLLKRFKIKDLGRINIWDIKPSKPVAYICFLMLFMVFAIRFIENETLYYLIITLSILAGIVLLYYGYLFVVLYGVIVLHRNVGAIYILLAFFVPLLLLSMMIFGFLYAAGPLRDYLERKIPKNIVENNNNKNE